jgi:nucleoside-diphosphate-sugar epimerase
VDFTKGSMQEQYNVNALAPAILSSWCVSNGRHLVQTSGSIVNGDTITQFNNDSIETPINYYGSTKLLADRAIRLSQCDHTIVRFGGIFGEGGPNHLGINNVINQAKIGNIPTVIGKGNALRNYIHVQDAAKLLVYCLDKKIIGTHYSGNHQPISIAQMIKDICSVYLDGANPSYKDGSEAINQIIEVSNDLPQTMLFKDALIKYQ